MQNYLFSVDFKFSHDLIWPHYFKLVNIDQNSKLQVLEVGTFEGNTATWFSDNLLDHPDSTLTCVDNFSGLFDDTIDECETLKDRWLSNVRISKNYDKISLIQGESRYVLHDLVLQEKQYDVIYIDASHFTPDVIIDGILGFQLLKPNGLLIFDDDLLKDNEGRYPVKDAISMLKKMIPEMEPIVPTFAGLLPLGDTWEKLFTKR